MSRGATPTRICPRTARRPLLDLPSPLTAIPAVGIRLSRRTTNKTTVCSASLLTLWLARPPFPIPPSKERWAVQTPPSLPGARFPALPDKESASRRSNGRTETLEPRLGAPPLPHSGVGQKAGPCQVLLLAHGSLHPSARRRLACALLSPPAKGSLLFWPSRYRQQAPPGLLSQGAADSPDLGTRPPPSSLPPPPPVVSLLLADRPGHAAGPAQLFETLSTESSPPWCRWLPFLTRTLRGRRCHPLVPPLLLSDSDELRLPKTFSLLLYRRCPESAPWPETLRGRSRRGPADTSRFPPLRTSTRSPSKGSASSTYGPFPA